MWALRRRRHALTWFVGSHLFEVRRSRVRNFPRCASDDEEEEEEEEEEEGAPGPVGGVEPDDGGDSALSGLACRHTLNCL